MATEKADLSEVSDEELMEDALADEEVTETQEQVETPEETQDVEAQPEEVEAEQPAATEDEKPSEAIPAWRLRETADAKRAAEQLAEERAQQNAQLQAQLATMQQQLQQMQQPRPDPIDPDIDPHGYQQQQFNTLHDQFNQRLVAQSRAFAESIHGKQVVDEAFSWCSQNLPHHESVAIANSADPFGQCVERKKQADALAEFGTDPKAYRERVLSEAMKDPDYVQKVIQAQREEAENRPENSTVKLPPSLNKQTAAASAKADAGDSLPQSDKELFEDAMRWNPRG